MKLEDELTAALIDGYEQAGKEIGYWAHRYVQALRRNGGLAAAKRMLQPRTSEQRKGLDTLLEAGRPDLTLEFIICQEQFRSVFTSNELSEAAKRLGNFESTMKRIRARATVS
jgi:5-methylcytosine-specific restriction protein A